MVGTLYKHPDGKIHIVTNVRVTLVGELETVTRLHGVELSSTTPYGFWLYEDQL